MRQAVASKCIVTWQEFIGMSSHQQAGSKVVLFYGFNGDNDITLHASDASWDDLDSTGSIDGSSWHSITRMMWAMPEIRYVAPFTSDWVWCDARQQKLGIMYLPLHAVK